MINRADYFSVLTEFNPALVYAFSPTRPESERGSLGYSQHIVGQHRDTLSAYLYAQETLLPEIRKIGIKNITEEQILQWLNQIHERAAATLAKDLETVSGVYTKQQLLTWVETDVRDLIANYFLGFLPEADLESGCSKLGVELADAKAFINLLFEFQKADIDISKDQLEYININSPIINYVTALGKLITLYQTNSLDSEQKEIIHKLVKIYMPPKQLKSAMQDYAKDLVAKLKQCDAKNIDNVVSVLFDAFYGFNEIHPYFKGNNSTITCWINTLLRVFGYPSILLRNPQERNNPNSAYSSAIKVITTNPALMRAYLKQCIQDAEKGLVFKDDELRELIQLRMKVLTTLSEVQKKYESSDEQIENLYNQALREIMQEIKKNDEFEFDPENSKEGYTNALSLYINKEMNAYFDIMLSMVLLSDTEMGLKNHSMHKPKYDAAKKAEIVNFLKRLTGKQEEKLWKVNDKNNKLVIHLNLNDQEQAQSLQKKVLEAIKDSEIVKITQGRNKGKNKEVVSFEIINADKLLNNKSASKVENTR